MTRIQRILITTLAAIAAAIILLWTPDQETWGQDDNTPTVNTPPVIGTPKSTSLSYLFPRGKMAVLEFSSEPVTDDDESDTTTVRFDFILTDDENDTTDPAGALFKVTEKDQNFEFTAKDGVTPEDFTALYGNVVSHVITVKMYANDGTQDSLLPLSFTITAYHDASPQFHHSAEYRSEQRWELDTDTIIEVYEGPQANSELGKIILGSYDEENNPTEGQPTRIENIDALQIPWTSTTGGTRTWTLGNRDGMADSPKIKCKDQDQGEPTLQNWVEPGSADSTLFSIAPPGDQQQGHIPLQFQSTFEPNYENPQDDGTDNEYLVRLVSGHGIHKLGMTDDETLGCDGSALDLKIKVKDVRPPAWPPKPTKQPGLTLTLENKVQDQFSISWKHDNQFIENEKWVDFPDPSFNVTLVVISYAPDGLQFLGKPLANPLSLPPHFSGIEHVNGIPGVTYTITAELRNSESSSDTEDPSSTIFKTITPLGPPAVPEAPTVRPESDTSIRAVWKEPENNGGRPITGYKVRYKKDGPYTWKTWSHTGTGTSATITNLDEMQKYNVQIKAQNNLGASSWSRPGTGSTASLVVQIASGTDVVSGNDAVFTVTLSKPADVTVKLSHAWIGGYGDSASGMLEFANEISKNYTLTTDRGNPEDSGRSVTVTIDTDAAYVIGTNGSATVDIEQNSNNQPTLANPSNRSLGAVYKFPAGKTDGIKYGSEPGTDLDGGKLTYLITFTKPGTDSEEEEVTIPAVGSPPT